ncbi:MAG: hypothetical protein B6D57_01870 [Candidatus Coatesbacteria bacterium 4484_99]|uniref:Uncharacterized protein n=1 Tax=Candidatus Coatesbacteria bacterium 4484_99 TaxID=1970774 RepID=A0A1W9S1U9_9BACT|nr:MAG: hypothetical protein B6D57_01870 [Candidatus Coatesbacteria bacterium 4484_99]
MGCNFLTNFIVLRENFFKNFLFLIYSRFNNYHISSNYKHIKNIHSCIWVYDLDGNVDDKIELNNLETRSYVWGLSRGRENISGYNESLYAVISDSDYYGIGIIYEIEVGDYNTAINSSSVGEIKAMFH